MRHVLDGTVIIATAPERHPTGASRREAYHRPRARKLSCEQEAAIRSEAGNRTLRELAAAFGVSHETIRTVLRRESLGTGRHGVVPTHDDSPGVFGIHNQKDKLTEFC